MLRHRVFKCEYLDRSGTDLRVDTGAAGAMNQRPLTATELEALSEYLWQFTMFNNSEYAVESSSGSTASGTARAHDPPGSAGARLQWCLRHGAGQRLDPQHEHARTARSRAR